MKASSTKSIVTGLIVGLMIGLAVGYVIMEQEVSRLEVQIERLRSQISERDSLINMFFLEIQEHRDLISPLEGKVIVNTMITLTDLDRRRDFFADFKKDDVVRVQLHVMGSPIDFYMNKGTMSLMQKTETLSEDFIWKVPEEGRYVFRIELKGYEYALVVLRIAVGGQWGTMFGTGTAGQEKVTIEAVKADMISKKVTVWCKSVGGGPVIITEVILRDASGSVVGVVRVDATIPADGTLVTVAANFPSMTAGVTYTVSLVSKLGNQFVSPAFKPM